MAEIFSMFVVPPGRHDLAEKITTAGEVVAIGRPGSPAGIRPWVDFDPPAGFVPATYVTYVACTPMHKDVLGVSCLAEDDLGKVLERRGRPVYWPPRHGHPAVLVHRDGRVEETPERA